MADVALTAVVINGALRSAPGDGVRLGDETRQTLTDSIVIGAHAAGGAGAAWAGVAGVGLGDTLVGLTNVVTSKLLDKWRAIVRFLNSFQYKKYLPDSSQDQQYTHGHSQ